MSYNVGISINVNVTYQDHSFSFDLVRVVTAKASIARTSRFLNYRLFSLINKLNNLFLIYYIDIRRIKINLFNYIYLKGDLVS